MFLGGVSKPEKAEETHADMRRTWKDSNAQDQTRNCGTVSQYTIVDIQDTFLSHYTLSYLVH